jgi:hypothetical protein
MKPRLLDLFCGAVAFVDAGGPVAGLRTQTR